MAWPSGKYLLSMSALESCPSSIEKRTVMIAQASCSFIPKRALAGQAAFVCFLELWLMECLVLLPSLPLLGGLLLSCFGGRTAHAGLSNLERDEVSHRFRAGVKNGGPDWGVGKEASCLRSRSQMPRCEPARTKTACASGTSGTLETSF